MTPSGRQDIGVGHSAAAERRRRDHDARSGTESGARRSQVRFAVLDGWRGIAAVMVVFFHFQPTRHFAEIGIVRNGWLFVDFFFVLSGYVIAHAYGDRLRTAGEVTRFMAGRIGRIYPLHVVMLAAYAGFEALRFLLPQLANPDAPPFEGVMDPAMLPGNLLLVHAWGIYDSLSWNVQSWSISAEFAAYLLFAFLVAVTGRWLLASLLVVAGLSFATIAVAAPSGMDSTYDFGVYRCFYGFALGAALYGVTGRRTVAARLEGASGIGRWLFWTVAEVVVVATCVLIVGRYAHDPVAILAPLPFAALVFVFAHEKGAISQVLRARPFQLAGLVSYSIYMTHLFVIPRCLNVLAIVQKKLGVTLLETAPGLIRLGGGNAWLGDAMMIVLLAILLATSYLTWRLIERPGQRLVRLLLAPRRVMKKGPVAVTGP